MDGEGGQSSEAAAFHAIATAALVAILALFVIGMLLIRASVAGLDWARREIPPAIRAWQQRRTERAQP